MVDSSLPKLMHKLFRDAMCIHVSVDGYRDSGWYLWLRFNSAELSYATLDDPYGGIWQVGLKKADNNIWSRNLVGSLSFHVLIFDKTATGIQYPPIKNSIQAAEKLKPKNPSFMGISRPHNKVYVPAEFFTKYIIGKQIVTLQCLVLLPPIKTYSATRFGKGWGAFSKDNNLEQGDVCVFEVIERKPIVLSVSILYSWLTIRVRMLCILGNGALQMDAYLCIDMRCEAIEQHMQHCEYQCSNGGQLTPKIIMNQFRDALPPTKRCIGKGCTSMYSRERGW
ncbi:b3 domain-containing transcription factor vrn1, partial [Quercus suber]